MAEVVAIRIDWARDDSHEHIVGVWLSDGQFRTNRQVQRALDAGEEWHSTGPSGERVPIGWVRWCPGMNCHESPYLVSSGSLQTHVAGGLHLRIPGKAPDALENLPERPSRPTRARLEGAARVGVPAGV